MKNSINDDNESKYSFFKNQLAKKDKQISFLQKKINNLVLNKNSLLSQVDSSLNKKCKNFISLKSISPQNITKHNNLFSSMHALKNENYKSRNIMNLSNHIESKYSSTFKYKLLNAQKEIENLTVMNTNKDNIIINVQNFLNNLNNIICKGKLNLDLNQIDIKTFITNLKNLETKIMEKLQKIVKPNKIPYSIIRKIKDHPIKKQKTEITLMNKKDLHIIPLNKRNYKKINTQINNNRKFSNSSLNKQNYNSLNINNIRNENLKQNGNITETNKEKQHLKLKKFFLNKKYEESSTSPPKDYIKYVYYNLNENFSTNNKEKTSNSLLGYNGNGSLFKKLIKNNYKYL
jgi:hypothetical protein